MAVDFGKLVGEVKEQIEMEELAGRRLAIDAYNTIYQFISIIRGPDGTPLTDSKNRVTSHLSGLFYRTINVLEKGIVPIFIFDGKPPLLKQRTLEARANQREEAYRGWQQARAKGQLEEARGYAMASSKINEWIIESSKELLGYMGVPYIQAPSEGEAQAARMVMEGTAYAAASQDYDLFLFGSDVIIRNLTVTGRRKLPGKNIYVNVEIERILLHKFLSHFGIDRKRAIWMGMLVGTDFNEGIEKVGPKTALKIVKEHGSLDEIVAYVKEKYNKEFDADPYEVERFFLEPDTIEIQSAELEKVISGSKPDRGAIIRFLCSEHEFSEERIGKYADKLLEVRHGSGQKGINSWL
ncbi:MAG: flap endonuclease-1 [Candidatus Micrarchaeota archaeon]|nr:flap endonuclease-1 [Candidatus Micrarchaeota archaeon]MDE1847822.1 flap endonuclease-1 [Candidatus Micrarchaeota archaeon]MDE1864372.1 flap endonuclease-1 [Candidatus Micrarchaeota archaeon]